MVDLKRQYEDIKEEIDFAIQKVINETAFINGPQVKQFAQELATYHNIDNVVPCGNGTDGLQVALMSLGLKPGDEVIVPAFTYVATIEVMALLGLKPVFVDVDENNFNIDIEHLEAAITKNTKCVVPVHLYGQCANMEAIVKIAEKYNLYTVEDCAQAIGADYYFTDNSTKKAGTIGTIGVTSFFPSKNLGCYGDGGALFIADDELAGKVRMIANHGQNKKYYHEIVGVNSRLDTLQAAILSVKLKKLNYYIERRNSVAAFYDEAFKGNEQLTIPARVKYSSHVFHQYTLKIKGGKRDALKERLAEKGIPSMVYYPIPLHMQNAYEEFYSGKEDLGVSEALSKEVLSLPIHTEMTDEELEYITSHVLKALV